MAISADFIARLNELFSDVPGCSIRKMFGGVGVFCRGLMFALATSDEEIAFKADELTVPAFKAEGARQWHYTSKAGKPASMGYWYLPERLLDDPDEFADWANNAFDVALRADAKKPPSQRKFVAI